MTDITNANANTNEETPLNDVSRARIGLDIYLMAAQDMAEKSGDEVMNKLLTSLLVLRCDYGDHQAIHKAAEFLCNRVRELNKDSKVEVSWPDEIDVNVFERKKA